ncbi:MAG: MTH895/ArsE family thioredoxin-like protein [Thermoanaerobaculaceae bacterium]|jgi:small redox-active disulfide protein 2|nr:MTH895/ArsE family thioredoxin-like protein [Thermoanaerobaculaceae bacterium]
MSEHVKRIEVFGPGCARCQETYRVVRHVVESAGLTCEVVKVDDITRMISMGIMATPAIAIDGTVVMTGRVPKSDEVQRLLGIA